MTPIPTGRIARRDDGIHEMTLRRSFRASADDVWASITEPERTARWFGAWRGKGGPGQTIQVQMGFEEGAPWGDMRIDACDPPHRLVVSMVDAAGEWNMEVRLAQRDGEGETELELIQYLADPSIAESSGPGWEYYLDMLVASRNDQPLPGFDDYYPAQARYYAEQAAASCAAH